MKLERQNRLKKPHREPQTQPSTSDHFKFFFDKMRIMYELKENY